MPLEQLGRHAELGLLDLVRISHHPAEKDPAAAWHRRQPLGDHSARAGLGRGQGQAPGAAQIEDQLLDAALVAAEEVALERRHQLRRQLVGAPLSARLDVHVDVDLEVAGADRRLHPVPVAARVRERLCHRRLARAEEAQEPHVRRPRPRENAAHGLRLDREAPQPLQLARRSRQHDDDALPRFQHQSRRRSRQPQGQRALRNRRLLAHPLLEVDVRTAHPLRERAGDPADLTVQALVEPQPDAGGTRDELDGAVVVRRPEPARHDAQIRAESFRERTLELLLAISDDHDARGLDAAPQELRCEKRAVQVAPVAADELAAGDDDDSARACQTPGRMPRAVTISVLTPPPDRTRVRPFRIVRRFSGRSSVIHSLRPVKTWRWPRSSVPWKMMRPVAEPLCTSSQQLPRFAVTIRRTVLRLTVGVRTAGVGWAGLLPSPTGSFF